MTDTQDTVTQALPTPGAGERMAHIPVLSIARSLTNPRKHFAPEKLSELADSIKASGVHQPILVRPLPVERISDEMAWARAEKRQPAEYELVCGERRWRASQIAAVAEIPAMIRPMTDAQALEAQVIENLQREDVTALEEAEGYQVLMDNNGMNADQVAEKIGKSRGYIYARLKILDLCPEGREAMRQGELDYSCALPIARIATFDLQREALEWALETDYRNDKRSARDVQFHVKNNYMLDLRKAPFSRKDADLCPSAGACTSCPHRTGADQDEDSKSADVCTNPPCYRNKEQAHADQLRKQAQERGCEVLGEREAKQLIGNYYSDFTAVPGYKRLDSRHDCPIEGKTLRKAIGAKVMEQSGIKPTMITNPNNPKELIPCVTPEQAQQLLQMAGHAEAEEKLAAEALQRAEREEKEAKTQAKENYERAWRLDVLQSVVKRLQQEEQAHQAALTPMSKACNRLAAQRLAGQLNGDDSKLLCKLLDLGKVVPKEAIRQAANDWNSPELLTGCIIALHDRSFWNRYDLDTNDWRPAPNTELLAMAEACGVDVEAAKAKAKANMRAAEAARKAATLPQNDAPKADLPQHPAARASGNGEQGKAPKGKKPAAQASEKPKTSAAHASAQIAEALQELEGSGAAAAAQGNDGAPVAVAQAPISGAKAQGNKAAPVAAKAAQGLPHSSEIEDDLPYPNDDAQQPAVAQAAAVEAGQGNADAKTGAALAIGMRVQVNESATGKKQKPWIDYYGTIAAQVGPEAWEVDIERAPRCKPRRVCFHRSELEASE
ncbi:MAG: ParB/RepB/Spo0J family partition protein [Comamonas sp.]